MISYKTEKVLQFYASPPIDPDRPIPDFYDELRFGDIAAEELARKSRGVGQAFVAFSLILVVALVTCLLEGNLSSIRNFYGPFSLGALCALLYVRLAS